MVKIILGLVEPDEGEVLVDGVPLARFGYKNYHEQVAAVLQNDNLFGGSLADNIALFDDSPDRDRIFAAAHAAAIHDDIVLMPMSYETLVGDMGSTLSGGQKQRVLLARALYRRPRVLVMDEGTSHLDSKHERLVNAAIAATGATRIIIAHRKETSPRPNASTSWSAGGLRTKGRKDLLHDRPSRLPRGREAQKPENEFSAEGHELVLIFICIIGIFLSAWL